MTVLVLTGSRTGDEGHPPRPEEGHRDLASPSSSPSSGSRTGIIVQGHPARRPRAAHHLAHPRRPLRAGLTLALGSRGFKADLRRDHPHDGSRNGSSTGVRRHRLHQRRPWPDQMYDTPNFELSGTSASTRSPTSAFLSASSGRSRSSWPTSSTRWGRSSESSSPPAISTRKVGSPRSASRCSSTRWRRWRAARVGLVGNDLHRSASGVAARRPTSWVAVVTGALFFPFMFFAPIIGMVPPEATAPALSSSAT